VTYRDHVLDHYRQEAAAQGLSETSTMADITTREKEVSAVLTLVEHLAGEDVRLLEIGCGNGLLLQTLRRRFPEAHLTGIDFSPDMVALAQKRDVERAQVAQGDVMALDFPDNSFDVIVGERVIINLMDRADQSKAFAELARVLKPGGHYVCVEAFADGLTSLNEAREELGLAPHAQAHHNLWFDEDAFRTEVDKHFEIIDPATLGTSPKLAQNFLSTHYFMSRVLYPALTRAELRYNTHFVRFFADDPPRGNYAPIQLFVLRGR
jgi:ubiquinone/menaquinone biosynthesis C-methylase UbiE